MPDNIISNMILSASGWRKIFAEENNPEISRENSTSLSISQKDSILSAGAALVFIQFLKNHLKNENPCIAVGLDSRPTGKAIGDAVIRTLTALDVQTRYLAIVPAPEIMAYVKNSSSIDGFIYISASHNPLGYNGFKFGLENGAVMGGEFSSVLIEMFKNLFKDNSAPGKLEKLLEKTDKNTLSQINKNAVKWKEEAYTSYLRFNLDIYSGGMEGIAEESGSSKIKPSLGISGDLNGSARCVSIDSRYFDSIGILHSFINNEPGNVVHAILPEGENLFWCRKSLEDNYKKDSRFLLGYMPDNDGDRGNLVYINRNGKSEILTAQEVFALACMAELSFMVYCGIIKYSSDGSMANKTAVVVNGPTSLRIEKIAHCFGVKVFRAEVGEANVVNLAGELLDDGWTVRFLGEGSNGGNITLPATVRDPLNTIGSIVRLLKIKQIYKTWLVKAGHTTSDQEMIYLDDIMETLPAFTTTETDDSLAKMKISTKDHGKLKNYYEKIFAEEWENNKDYLKKQMGITDWEAVNYMGNSAITGTGPESRNKSITGGLKIIFKNAENRETGFIWMRGSGTEPVFRVLADIEGKNRENERFLIEWQRRMIEKADILSF